MVCQLRKTKTPGAYFIMEISGLEVANEQAVEQGHLREAQEVHLAETDFAETLRAQVDTIQQQEAQQLPIDETRSQVRENAQKGRLREDLVAEKLRDIYPESKGYEVNREASLRDADGNVIRDPEGSYRRIDFVVTQDGQVVDSIEVTSENATKEAQMAKEKRIRESDEVFVRDTEGELCRLPESVDTRIKRVDLLKL